MSPHQKPEGISLRINRFLADAGCGSRRGVEELIRQGRVRVNGLRIENLGTRIDPATDMVLVDDQPVQTMVSGVVYAFHKPMDVVCTFKGQGGQPTLLPYKNQAEFPSPVMPVGRLDSDSTGLLLWTDDGALNQALCRPGSDVWKVYSVRLAKPLGAREVALFTNGELILDGRACRPCRLESQVGEDCLWHVQLHEGRRRQIRRMFRALGNKVLKLHRLAVGPVELGKLKPGDFRRVPPADVASLRTSAFRNVSLS